MRTIGMRLTSNVKGETTNMCSYCGVYWHRSDLRRGRDGKLSCPDEGDLPEMADQVYEQARARVPLVSRSTAEMGRSAVSSTPTRFLHDRDGMVILDDDGEAIDEDGAVLAILGASLHSDFDARTGVTRSGSAVSAWANSGTDTAALEQATEAKQPAYSATGYNGGPGVMGDGVDDELVATFATPLAVGTRPYVWLVGNFVSFPSTRYALSLSDAALSASIVLLGSSAAFSLSRNDDSGVNASVSARMPAPDANPHLFEFGFTSGGTAAFVRDGEAYATARTGTPDAALTIISLFGLASVSHGNFQAARVIVATGVTAAQAMLMRKYLRGPNFESYTGNSYGLKS